MIGEDTETRQLLCRLRRLRRLGCRSYNAAYIYVIHYPSMPQKWVPERRSLDILLPTDLTPPPNASPNASPNPAFEPQDNVNALAKSVQVQLKMDLAELEAVSIDKEINAGSTFFGDDDDDDDMPSALKGIFDDDDDDDDEEEEEEEGGKGNSAMKGTFDDDDDEDDDDDGATPKNDEKEKNKADFWADDDEDED